MSNNTLNNTTSQETNNTTSPGTTNTTSPGTTNTTSPGTTNTTSPSTDNFNTYMNLFFLLVFAVIAGLVIYFGIIKRSGNSDYTSEMNAKNIVENRYQRIDYLKFNLIK